MKAIRQPIDFNSIAKETGVRKGRVFFSTTFKEWVVSGDTDVDLICIDPPKNIGDKLNGQTITKVRIENNHWIFEL